MPALLTIVDDLPYVAYAVGASPSTGPFIVPFPLPTTYSTALKVSIAGVPTALFTFTPDVDVGIGYPTGVVTLTNAVHDCTVAIWRDMPIERAVDIASGPFNLAAVNAELDYLNMKVQDARLKGALTWSVGAGAPSNANGDDGDMYVDSTNSRLYGPKSGGVWPASYITLKGATGAPGDASLSGNNIWTGTYNYFGDTTHPGRMGVDGPKDTDSAVFTWFANGLPRWAAIRNVTAESGAQAGSNFDFYGYTDVGGIDKLIYRINRASGVFAFTYGPTVPTAAPGTNTAQTASTGFVKAAIDVVLGGVSAAFDTLSEIATELALKATTAYVDAADALKANLASPAFTGNPTAPTPTANDNDTSIATTAFVQGEIVAKAPLASPALTGAPTAPTAAPGTNTTQIATTAFAAAIAALKADLASPALTGTPTAPTQAALNNSTRVATTAYVDAATSAIIASADALVYKGAIDCSANPNYPAADAGWTYRVSVSGKIGGASGTVVEIGDLFVCNTDGTASGTQAGVGANWNVIQANIDGAVTGPASAVDNRVAFFNGTTGKIIKDSGLTLAGSNTGDQTITLTGDVAGSGVGSFAATIAAAAVTLAKMANLAQDTIIGRATGAGTGVPTALTTLPTGAMPALTGDVTTAGGALATTIAAAAVALAKMANMATSSLIYRKTAGTGVPEVNTLATLKTDLLLTGTNSGDQTIAATGEVTAAANASSIATTLDKTAITNRTQDTAPDPGADYLLTYDASATALKKILVKDAKSIEAWTIAISDETTTITTGTAKVTFRAPYAFTITDVRASVATVSSSGLPTVNIKEGGVTIFSTKPTIDASETSTQTAATPMVLSDTALADDALMTVDIDVAGTGAKGLKVVIIGYRT